MAHHHPQQQITPMQQCSQQHTPFHPEHCPLHLTLRCIILPRITFRYINLPLILRIRMKLSSIPLCCINLRLIPRINILSIWGTNFLRILPINLLQQSHNRTHGPQPSLFLDLSVLSLDADILLWESSPHGRHPQGGKVWIMYDINS